MATGRPMPRPRARRAPGSTENSQGGNDRGSKVEDETFFMARRPIRAEVLEEDSEGDLSSPSGAPTSRNSSPRRKKRKPLPEWVSQSGKTDVVHSQTEELHSPNASPRPERARSVSITPPPDLDDDMREFARRAVENVMLQNNAKRKPNHQEGGSEANPPTSDDTSLDLNADLAQYYRGPNAHQLRERALARERQLQEERRKRLESQGDAETPLPSSSVPQVISIDDSSDDEQYRHDTNCNTTLETQPEIDQAEPDEDSMTIVLRAAKGDPILVKVRPTTKIATILTYFRDNRQLSPGEESAIFLSFEGERLAPHSTVQEVEIENDDQLEVMY
ncbi:hypothetical protein MYAM1_000787 [Malassezia yamatoensis]|uniref:Ubiquitin-like domain-containing protein n=1 Tax=Malassezia yamatoensis TaxID=253288 RepID=A0AAJ6CGB1_9BASI|nr:hypothetical protein MYAM1_000787 [Malassezia yamatoensis]